MDLTKMLAKGKQFPTLKRQLTDIHTVNIIYYVFLHKDFVKYQHERVSLSERGRPT
jgi:hypothetical protein